MVPIADSRSIMSFVKELSVNDQNPIRVEVDFCCNSSSINPIAAMSIHKISSNAAATWFDQAYKLHGIKPLPRAIVFSQTLIIASRR